jgi:DNA-binding XRE family transcriptional regulator
MTVSLETLMDRLPPQRRAHVEARATELIAQERTLRDVRQAHSLTQERMADLLGVSQESVSRIERRTDMLLSTLTSYIEAMGGSLKLVAEFPGKGPVTIQAISDLSDRPVGKLDNRKRK